MAHYTSHIYAEPKAKLLSYLQSHTLLSSGLYHLRKGSLGSVKDIESWNKEGVVVVREVCDSADSSDEAKTHQFCHAPILSWSELQGPPDAPVISPPPIPTLAFGRIYHNHAANLPLPVTFLRFLKHLSVTYDALIASYHHYTAYEDRLADAEYAWVFGKQDCMYLRHADEPYRTMQYTSDGQSVVIHSAYTKDQPILHEVMRQFGITLASAEYRPYFYSLKWEKYKV